MARRPAFHDAARWKNRAGHSPPAEQIAMLTWRVGLRSVEVIHDPVDALAALLRRQEDVLLVTGSLYLVSILRVILSRWLRKKIP